MARLEAPEQQETIGAYLEAYARMLLIRQFETAMHRLFLRGEVHGTTHLYAGQEAVAVGVCMALDPMDYVAGTYRGHGHALAKGTPPEPLIAEMLGRATGVCGGRAGSMNVIDLEHGLVGCYGIVGGSIAAALGAGLSAKRQGRVAVCFFGDGATNQAYFHECMNMAAVQRLPVVFVCENNLYAEFTVSSRMCRVRSVAARAAAYGIEAREVDGNDVAAVGEAAGVAIDRCRTGSGPVLLEAHTYRWQGHYEGDAQPYKSGDEVAHWKQRDPLILERERLLAAEAATADELEAAVREAESIVERAVSDARQADDPELTEAYANVLVHV